MEAESSGIDSASQNRTAQYSKWQLLFEVKHLRAEQSGSLDARDAMRCDPYQKMRCGVCQLVIQQLFN